MNFNIKYPTLVEQSLENQKKETVATMKTSKEINTTILTKSKKQFDFSALSVGFIGSKKAKQIEVITADDRTVFDA